MKKAVAATIAQWVADGGFLFAMCSAADSLDIALAAQALSDRNFDKVEKLTAWAEERGHTILDLAFAWLLGHPAEPSVIAGATKPEQVAANAATASWKLTPAEVAEVSKIAAE